MKANVGAESWMGKLIRLYERTDSGNIDAANVVITDALDKMEDLMSRGAEAAKSAGRKSLGYSRGRRVAE